MIEWYLVNNGKIKFPNDFSKIFSSDGNYLISRFYGSDYYFEMSGESMYYAIKGLENSTSVDNSEYKSRIVKAITKRMEQCNGILYHKSLVPGKIDTQLRATNSALRILIQASLDGYNVGEDLNKLLSHHFQYYMNWGDGIWFCHDQSEYEKEIRKCQLKSTVWGKEIYNTLTLNTHLDSLNTLLVLTLNIEKLDIDNTDQYKYLLEKGIVALNTLISKNPRGFFLDILQRIDKEFYFLHLHQNPVTHFVVRAYDRFIHPFFFKKITPVFFFNYGYIARDMAVKSRHLDYLPANIADFLRFYSLINSSSINTNCIDIERIRLIILRSVNLLFALDSLYTSDNDIAWKCEIKYFLDRLLFEVDYPETWKTLSKCNYTIFLIDYNETNITHMSSHQLS